jgi:hypothetical protein
MSDQLEESIRRLLDDARLDLSLEFHRAADGTKSGTIQVKDAEGQIVASVPLESPEAMNVALARLVLLGFRSSSTETSSLGPAPPEQTTGARVDASVLVAESMATGRAGSLSRSIPAETSRSRHTRRSPRSFRCARR